MILAKLWWQRIKVMVSGNAKDLIGGGEGNILLIRVQGSRIKKLVADMKTQLTALIYELIVAISCS